MANQFLVKNTMADMRDLSVDEIASLQGLDPIYVGVQLLGYYDRGDTPSPIIYYFSSTETSLDDGGSIIVLPEGRLIHNFGSEVFIGYFGAKGDLLQNDSPFIQKALDYCRQKKRAIAYGIGDYRIEDTLKQFCSSLTEGCKLHYYGSSVALQVNWPSSGSGALGYLSSTYIEVPDIIAGNKIQGDAWASVVNTRGVVFENITECNVKLGLIENFEIGLFLTSSGGRGSSYNQFYINHLKNNKCNIRIKSGIKNSQGAVSWCNENLFIGGRLSKRSDEKGDGTINDVTVVTKGKNYSYAHVTLTGGGGTGALATAEIKQDGTIETIKVINKGSGYISNPTVVIDGDGQLLFAQAQLYPVDSNQIELLGADDTGGGVDNNKFIHNAIEGNNIHWHILCQGVYNNFDNLRFEASVPKVKYERILPSIDGGSGNSIWRGYGVHNLKTYTFGGANRNYLDKGYYGVSKDISLSDSIKNINNSDIGRYFHSAEDHFNDKGAYNNWSTAYGHNYYKLKESQDKFPRLWLRADEKRIYFGDGNQSSTEMGFIGSDDSSLVVGQKYLNVLNGKLALGPDGIQLQSGVEAPEGFVTGTIGDLYAVKKSSGDAQGSYLYMKLTSSGNVGWRMIQTLRYGATRYRPVLSMADVGYQFFDTTISKPIWWNGSEWLDIIPISISALNNLIKQSEVSSDVASVPSTVYSQSEVQAILTELRNLKNKLRNAGLIAI